MEAYLIYIGKSALAAGAFYLVYLLLFQNQKEFIFNRFYLLVSLVLSFIIPLITFTKIQFTEAINTNSLDNSAFLTYLPETTQKIGFTLQWIHYLIGIYLLGIAIFVLHLIIGHIKALAIVRYSRIKELFKTEVNVTSKDVHPFSFFNKIVLSEKTLKNPSLEIIVSHENIHVKEKHTLDILIAEILFLFQWFNPFAWLIKDAIKNNLEYKTDHQIAKSYNQQDYQMAMVGLADKQGVAPFLTDLNGSQLKNRIIMMKKKTENKYAFLKQLLVLPLLAILIMGLANREIKTKIIQPSEQAEETMEKTSTNIKNNHRIIHLVKSHNRIKGIVTDQYSGNPVPNANINLELIPVETTSDDKGYYEVNFGRNEKTVAFEVSAKGYHSNVVVYYGTKEEINVILTPDDNKTTTTKFQNNIVVKETATNEKREPIYGDLVAIKGKPASTITDTNGTGIINAKLNNKNKRLGSLKLKNTDSLEFVEVKNVGSTVNIKGFNLEGKNTPMFVVNGVEVKNISSIPLDDIKSITVLKDEFAIKDYGKKGKNGVVLISTKKPVNFGEKLIFIDDKEYSGEIKDIDPNNIESVSVLKGDSATNKYGSKGKNGVILITTKTAAAAKAIGNTQLIVDGKEYKGDINDISPSDILSVEIKKNQTKTKYNSEDITTPLELRKFIAKRIKYPKEAQDANLQTTSSFKFRVDKNGNIFDIADTRKEEDIKMEEIVVIGYKSKLHERDIRQASSIILHNEMKRVLKSVPQMQIPEYKDKTIQLTVKFGLQ